MLDLPTRDLAALADGFTLVTIGRNAAGSSMRVGDAFAMQTIKATGEAREVDASFKDNTRLLAESFLVEGDARAPLDTLTLVGKSAEIRRVNVHTPNNSNPDSGLTAKQLVLDLQDTLQVGGWLIGEQTVDIDVAATTGEFSVTTDVGSTIRQTASAGSLAITGNKGLRFAGEVSSAAANANPAIQAGTRLDLLGGLGRGGDRRQFAADADRQPIRRPAHGQRGAGRCGGRLLVGDAGLHRHRRRRADRHRFAARTAAGRPGRQQRRPDRHGRHAAGRSRRHLRRADQHRSRPLPAPSRSVTRSC